MKLGSLGRYSSVEEEHYSNSIDALKLNLDTAFASKIMIQDIQTIRYYQKLTDAMVDLWNRGRRFEELRLYMDGYLSCLRHSNTLEPYLIHRLEEEVFSFLRDPSNFELSMPSTERDYY